jgi:hypothetical protein
VLPSPDGRARSLRNAATLYFWLSDPMPSKRNREALEKVSASDDGDERRSAQVDRVTGWKRASDLRPTVESVHGQLPVGNQAQAFGDLSGYIGGAVA